MKQKIYDSVCNMWIGNSLKSLIIKFELIIMGLYQDKKDMSFIKEIIKEKKPFLLKPSELFMIYSLAKNQKYLDGDYAEVGVFKGTTAKAVCEVKENKHLHLFDTFNGLPDVDEIDQKFSASMYKSNKKEVEERLSKYKNVHIYKGLFQENNHLIKNKKFVFVNLDIDLYKGTKDCLEFFYNRMSKNGILISHDYHAQGVRKAFDEFLEDKPEEIIRLPLSQCMIIKR